MMIVASFFALLGATAGEVGSVLSWLLVAGTGALTLHGASLLWRGHERGLNWLVGGQLFCMAFILSLCAWQLSHMDLEPLRANVTDKMRESFKQTDLTEDGFLRLSYWMTYGFFAVFTILYQGGMALFYHRRRAAVTAALQADEA